jgi:hypothetical protein
MSPYKTFASGEVLTASDLQAYSVDQSVMTFASSAARTTALAAPSQGMLSFLNDSGTLWQYYELYNVSTNPGGAVAAGWYPASGTAMFFGTATRSAASGTVYNMGASGYAFTEYIDPLAWRSPSSNTDRVVPNVAGLYRVIASSQTAANVTGNRRIQLSRNGSPYAEVTAASVATNSTNGVSAVMIMNGSTDYVTAQTDQSSGASLTVNGQLSVEFIRPTII